MAVRSRFENLQRQRKKGGRRKDAGHAFVADAGGRLSGKRYSSSSARGRGKRQGGRSRGGRRNHKDGEDREQHKATSGKAGGGRADRAKGNSAQCKRCGETGHKSGCCHDQVCGVCGGKGHLVEVCGVCGGKGHLAEVCANVVNVLACESTKGSNDESDAAISVERRGGLRI